MAGTLVIDTLKSSLSTPPVFRNTSDVEVGQLCRAWVNFNGTATPPTVRASFNVSSVTRLSTGRYQLNFTTGMPDVNYSLAGTSSLDGTFAVSGTVRILQTEQTSTYLTGSCVVGSVSLPGNTMSESIITNVAIFR